MPNQTLAQIKLGSGMNKPGKTAREHENGKWARRLTNKTTRAAWNRQAGSKGGKRDEFPTGVCNGRRTQALRAANARTGRTKGKSAIGGKNG